MTMECIRRGKDKYACYGSQKNIHNSKIKHYFSVSLSQSNFKNLKASNKAKLVSRSRIKSIKNAAKQRRASKRKVSRKKRSGSRKRSTKRSTRRSTRRSRKRSRKRSRH